MDLQRNLSRRAVLQMGSGLGVTAMLAGAAARAEAANTAAEDKPVQLAGFTVALPTVVTAKNVANNISPDKLATTFLFDNLIADQNSDQTGAAQGTPYCMAILELPLANTEDPDLLCFTVDLRGNVSKSEGTRIAINLDVGGVSTVVEFPCGEELDGDYNRRIVTPYPKNRLVTPSDPGPEPGVPVSERAKAFRAMKFVAMICLSIQRSHPTDNGLVTVDSLDVEAIRRPRSKPGGENGAVQKDS